MACRPPPAPLHKSLSAPPPRRSTRRVQPRARADIFLIQAGGNCIGRWTNRRRPGSCEPSTCPRRRSDEAWRGESVRFGSGSVVRSFGIRSEYVRSFGISRLRPSKRRRAKRRATRLDASRAHRSSSPSPSSPRAPSSGVVSFSSPARFASPSSVPSPSPGDPLVPSSSPLPGAASLPPPRVPARSTRP